jgi:hypothetical protein
MYNLNDMKRILFFLMAAVAIVVFGSCQRDTTCRIHGTVGKESLNGKRIFLVPLFGPQTAEYVDSVVIENGKFEFTTDSAKMFKILVDYHYRMGIQQLLVVGEPGDVEVRIDSVSSAHGARQNDSLQAWKELTEQYAHDRDMYYRTVGMLRQNDHMEDAAKIEKQGHEVLLAYKNRTRQMAANMKGTTLGDFLEGVYPKTYQKKMPDGKIVTIDADTDEPINQ